MRLLGRHSQNCEMPSPPYPWPRSGAMRQRFFPGSIQAIAVCSGRTSHSPDGRTFAMAKRNSFRSGGRVNKSHASKESALHHNASSAQRDRTVTSAPGRDALMAGTFSKMGSVLCELEFALVVDDIDAIQSQDMKVRVEVQGIAEALNECDGPASSLVTRGRNTRPAADRGKDRAHKNLHHFPDQG